LVAADGTLAVPASIGLCILVMFFMKIVGANILRLLLKMRRQDNASSEIHKA
jgi:nucleoside recognition membrane protein YjiH